jgi:hypothetical protein
MAKVFNLLTAEWTDRVSLSPADAVIASYAQSRGDWNTWDYQRRYSSQLEESETIFTLGDYSAFKEKAIGEE